MLTLVKSEANLEKEEKIGFVTFLRQFFPNQIQISCNSSQAFKIGSADSGGVLMLELLLKILEKM